MVEAIVFENEPAAMNSKKSRNDLRSSAPLVLYAANVAFTAS